MCNEQNEGYVSRELNHFVTEFKQLKASNRGLSASINWGRVFETHSGPSCFRLFICIALRR